MSDAQRERTQGKEAARDAGPVEHSNTHSDGRGYASAPVGARLGRDPVTSDQDDSQHDGVSAGQPASAGRAATSDDFELPGDGGPTSAGAITVQVVGRTDVGLVREHNEDNYLLADLATGSRDPATFHEVSPAGLLLAVCDGMGGAAAGEVASQMAVDTLYEMMRRSVPPADRDGLARSLVRSVEEAGTRIFESARADRSRRGMGTTATVAGLMDRTLFVGQVGDSRAYVLRNGELKQITKDQSLVNQLIEAGQLTEDEAEAFEHSNIILQALGTTEAVSVDLTFLELRCGDRLLMCSDGLSGLVHGDKIRETLSEIRALDVCCERLIELAKDGGGHDNVTVILAEFGGAGLAQPQPTDIVGYQQYPLPLDQDRKLASPLHSDMPTLAPPSMRAPAMEEPEPGRDIRSAQSASSSAGRLFLFAILIVGAAGAVYYWMAERERRAHRVDGQPAIAPVAAADEAVAHVELEVHSDVEAGELVADGVSYGSAADGSWKLELLPGAHRLEARSGGSLITYKIVTVSEGVPQKVELSLPEGASGVATDAGGTLLAAPARESSSSKRRERSSSSRGDGGERRSRRHQEREPGSSAPAAAASPTSAPAPLPLSSTTTAAGAKAGTPPVGSSAAVPSRSHGSSAAPEAGVTAARAAPASAIAPKRDQ
jgi:PPM family protein phosphatase